MRHLDVAVQLRPSYLEAISLKERILRESNPDKYEKIKRNVLDAVEK